MTIIDIITADALLNYLVFVFVFRIDMHEMLRRVSKVLDGQPKLIDKFNRLLPPSMPLSTFVHSNAQVFILLLIMVALCNRADHYIFAPWFLSSSFFFFLA